MIKLVSLAVFIFFQNIPSDLKKMREQFVLLSKEKTSVDIIKDLALKSKEVNPNVKKAYYAVAEMSSAQYKSNPASKLKAFNLGKTILEATIIADTNNIEARYIRYTIQQNAPGFLGYNKNTKSDKLFLIQRLNSIKVIDKELFSTIYAYLLVNAGLSEQEKSQINH